MISVGYTVLCVTVGVVIGAVGYFEFLAWKERRKQGPWKGTLSHIRIYNRALPAEEVALMYGAHLQLAKKRAKRHKAKQGVKP